MNPPIDFHVPARYGSAAPAYLEQGHAPQVHYPEKQDRHSSLLLDYLRTMTRFRWVIAACAVLGILASFLFNLSTLPVYRARTSLDIQNLNGNFMNMNTLSPTGGGDSSSSEAYVQTQIKLLQSDTLLDRTVARLQAEPHPKVIERDDLISQLKRTLHLPGGDPLAYQALIEDAARQVKVKPLGLTRLVEITCDSWNAAFSAKFCNTLTQEFKDEDLEVRSTEAQRTSDWLTRQVADVRVKAEESQKKLEEATGGNGLAYAQDNSVGEDRLRQMQAELIRAQADRMEREAQAGVASSASAATLPSVLDDPNYRQLQQQLTSLQNKVAELVRRSLRRTPRSSTSAPRSGRCRRSSRPNARPALAAWATNSTPRGTARPCFAPPTTHKCRTSRRRWARPPRSTSFAVRSKASSSSTRRCLAAPRRQGSPPPCRPPPFGSWTPRAFPAFPSRPVASPPPAIGLLLGSAFGIGFAFFKERSTQTSSAFPETRPRYLHVQELGVIPTADAGQRKSVVASIQRRALARPRYRARQLPRQRAWPSRAGSDQLLDRGRGLSQHHLLHPPRGSDHPPRPHLCHLEPQRR